ncbi:Transcriptional regulator PadR-like family protein [Nonomuraea coxensis DSM 45129]|uniref:Transcriptional regulator PadR-like family protein n=2 Tax=Nonomuraea coxensis TaxID=404386 RepID=A0ABX8U7F1_9ACTN|nr:Transcriptional regulator PadR-like family protein [Nonomuraea coxensis DSM 45129]
MLEGMSLQHALLGVLEARPMNGYELTRFFEAAPRWVWSAPQSQIYPTLRQMEQAGLIEGQKEIRGTRLRRTVYSITERGLAELRAWLGTAHTPPPARDAFFLQALFFDMIEPDRAASVLKAFIAEQEQLAAEWRAHREALLAKDTPLLKERLKNRPAGEHDRIAALKAHVFAGQIAVATARAAWARESLRLLEEPTPP